MTSCASQSTLMVSNAIVARQLTFEAKGLIIIPRPIVCWMDLDQQESAEQIPHP